MALRQDGEQTILFQEHRLQRAARRKAEKAAVDTAFGDPRLDLGVIAEQQLIIDVRMIGLKRADDAREPVRRDT